MTTSAGNKVRLYELALGNGRSASPFVWRIRYALAHKDIAFETVKLGFTDIPTLFGGKFKTGYHLDYKMDTPMANLLVSKQLAKGQTRFSEWLAQNASILGTTYASELARHYR